LNHDSLPDLTNPAQGHLNIQEGASEHLPHDGYHHHGNDNSAVFNTNNWKSSSRSNVSNVVLSPLTSSNMEDAKLANTK
jgi:hypothetical protein